MHNQTEHIDIIYNLAAKKAAEGLSEQEQIQIEEIISKSEENKSLWNELSKTWDLVNPNPQIEVQVDSNKAWEQVSKNAHINAKTSGLNNSWFKFTAAATVIGIVLSLGIWNFNQTDQVNFENNTYSSIDYKLPDQSLVRLEPNSSIEFIENFEGENREVEMKGEIFFDVIKNSKPFIIHTTLLDIQVTGTSFYVSDIKGKEVEVSVIEGTVNLQNRKKKDQIISLSKGETGKYIRTEKAFQKIEKDLNLLYPKTKRLIFNRTPLKKVFKVLEKTFNVSIQLDDTLKSYRYTGNFTEQSFEEILEVISITLDLTIEKSQNEILIKGNPCK